MRALQGTAIGDPADVLRIVDMEPPALAPGEVRIAPVAVGLNFLDVMLCRGTYPVPVPPPFVPGVEMVGAIVEVHPEPAARPDGGTHHDAGADPGSRQHALQVGAMVVACPTLPRGCLAETAVIDSGLVVPLPADSDPIAAAVLPVNYQTAYFALKQAGLRPGDTVLVHAGAGGVGIAATQLARAWGATVIATAGGATKTEVCRAQGASVAIDYVTDDFVTAVQAATNGRGVDIVIDSVGGDTFARSLQVLAFQGRIVPVGSASGNPAPVDPMLLTARNISIVGLSWGSAYPFLRPEAVRAAYTELFAMMRTGQVDPVIHSVVELAEAPDALALLEQRGTIGKVVVGFGEFAPQS